MRKYCSKKLEGWTSRSRRGRTPVRGQSPSPASPANSSQSNIPPPPQPHLNSSTQSNPGTPSTPALTNLNAGFILHPALKQAIEERVAKIPDNDRSSFQTAGDIMDKISATDARHAQSSLSRAFGSRIERILQVVKGFVAILGPCVPSSQIASIVVGGLNFVLSLVLGYIEFFGSLTTMMERIAEHLDYLTLYGSRVFQSSSIVQKALVQAYIDLLDFFLAVRDVFGNLDSRVKSFRLFLRLTWEPFNIKFQPVHDRFLAHTLIVVRAAGVENLVRSLEKEPKEDSQKEVALRRQVLQWLTLVDYEETHQRHFKKHFANTGQWLIEHEQFVWWKETPGSRLLWCYGIPGSGKTVLASLVIEHLSQYELSDRTGFCFVYCNYKEPQDTSTYVRSLIKQLQRSIVDIQPKLATYFNNDRKPGYAELTVVLQQLAERFDKLFIVIDALDECSPEQRGEILEVLQALVSPGTSHTCHVKLFITSREESDIKRALTTFPMIPIEAKKVNEDIEAYVTDKMSRYLATSDFPIEDGLRNKIRSTLVNKAGGMFLWVEFQLEHIFAQTSAGHIERALISLPEDMDRTYDRIIDRINKSSKPKRQLARRTLMWIAYAQRPLTEKELTCAVAMECNIRNAEELNSMIPTIGTVVEMCSSLIVATYDEIRFVHFSVQEYILSKSRDPGNTSITALDIGPNLAQVEISTMCITFGLFCWLPRDERYQYNSRFCGYALKNWMSHVRAVSGIHDDLLTLILKYFDFGPFCKLIPVFMSSVDVYEHEKQTKFSPITIALIFDLPVISNHLATFNHDDCYPDEKYAIHFAARHDSHAAIEGLCNRGFKVDVSDHDQKTPIYYATEINTFRSLLKNGADVHAHNGHALIRATQSQKAKSVQFLLANGANSRCSKAWYNAITSSDTQITEILLDAGADANAEVGDYGQALYAAALNGSVGIVKLLLDHGAHVNGGNGGDYGNALQASAAHGYKDILQLLLDRGADPHAQGGKYGNALQAAARNRSNEGLVEFLLDKGVDVNRQGGYYGNALQASAAKGDKDILQLLLDRGADPNAQGGKYGNALQAAACNRSNEGLVELLLDTGVDVNRQGGYYGNALQAAAADGTLAILQVLLNHGADVNAEGGEFGTALQAAAAKSKEGAILLLFDHRANVNAQGGKYGNALQAAAADGTLAILQVLLNHGADVNAEGGEFGTALQAAAAKLKQGAILLLLDHGANVNAQGGRYGNALQAVVQAEKEDLVILLNAQRGEYGKAVAAGARQRFHAIQQILLDRGAVY